MGGQDPAKQACAEVLRSFPWTVLRLGSLRFNVSQH
jgi:hypothetical protein